MSKLKSTPPPDVEVYEQEDGHGARMGFLEHLDELRRRLIRSVIGIGLGTAIGSVFAGQILQYLGGPYLNLTGGNEFLIIDPTGSVVAYFRVALLVGATLAVRIVT